MTVRDLIVIRSINAYTEQQNIQIKTKDTEKLNNFKVNFPQMFP